VRRRTSTAAAATAGLAKTGVRPFTMMVIEQISPMSA